MWLIFTFHYTRKPKKWKTIAVHLLTLLFLSLCKYHLPGDGNFPTCYGKGMYGLLFVKPMICRRIAGKTWGSHLRILWRMFTMTVKIIIIYEVVAWTSRTKLRITGRHVLDKVQKLACICIIRGMTWRWPHGSYRGHTRSHAPPSNCTNSVNRYMTKIGLRYHQRQRKK